MEARAAPDHVITANAEDLMPLNYDQLSRTVVRMCGTNGWIYGKTYRECVTSEKKKLCRRVIDVFILLPWLRCGGRESLNGLAAK